MKKVLLMSGLAFFTMFNSNAQTTIFNGENISMDSLGNIFLDSFNISAKGEVVDTVIFSIENPDKVINTSDSVGMFVRGTSTAADKYNKQIRFVAPCDTVFDVAQLMPSDSMAGNVGTVTITMDVWTNAPVASVIEFSFSETETWPNTRHATLEGATGVSGQWETVSFTYAQLPPLNANCCGFDPATLPEGDEVPMFFVAFGHGSENATADTFYFDNIVVADLMPGVNADLCGGDTTTAPIDTTDGISSSIKAAINLYPNPATSQITVSSSVKIDNVQISNIAGNVVLSTSVVGTIDVSGLPSGIYIIKYTSGDDVSFDKLVLK